MFASLNGKILEINDDNCTLDVMGVGYLIHCTANLLNTLNINDTKIFYIQTIVKEDNIALYGFTELIVKKLFNSLITVQGVGPRIAMAILSTFTANQIIQAIMLKDMDLFKQVSGVGTKVAQRIVNELWDKIKKFKEDTNFVSIDNKKVNNNVADAISALLALGYNNNQINNAINNLSNEIKDSSAENIIKNILKGFAHNL